MSRRTSTILIRGTFVVVLGLCLLYGWQVAARLMAQPQPVAPAQALAPLREIGAELTQFIAWEEQAHAARVQQLTAIRDRTNDPAQRQQIDAMLAAEQQKQVQRLTQLRLWRDGALPAGAAESDPDAQRLAAELRKMNQSFVIPPAVGRSARTGGSQFTDSVAGGVTPGSQPTLAPRSAASPESAQTNPK
jgi:hypothetical protein